MKKLIYITAAGALMLGSCAAPKLAKESVDDDFYAKEYEPREVYAAEAGEEGDEYTYRRDYDGSYEDDFYGGYTYRLRRFHSPFRGYGYFDYYDPFFYDPWMSPGINLGFNMGWGGYYGYRPWGFYSYSPYYYNTPYWGYNYAYNYGGYWGGYHPGYYYSRPIYRPSVGNGTYNRPRPRVGTTNNGNYSRPRPGGSNGNVSERPVSRPRPQARPATREPSSTADRPAARPRPKERPRTERASPPRETQRPQARPRPQSRPSYSPPPRSSSPRSSGSSGGSSGRSGGGSRPRPR